MYPIDYIALMAQTEVAEKFQNFGRERVTLDRMWPVARLMSRAKMAYANVSQFLENARAEFQNWSDSQRACLPGSPVLSDC